jgi:hypothetical protein
MGTTPNGAHVDFWDQFDLDVPRAIKEQLVDAFAHLHPALPSNENLGVVPAGRGVYQLFKDGELVYVGKAEDLRNRLLEHRCKISGRKNITVDQMTFACLSIGRNWAASAPEESLIAHYREIGQSPWNGMGFGNHDPGRNRDRTIHPAEGWDYQYPIREDWVCDWVLAGQGNARELLESLKARLPYLLRYERAPQSSGHPDYDNVILEIPQAGMTAEALLRLVAQTLPGWQATRFPSKIILYKEQNVQYSDAVIRWPLET